MTDKRLRVFSHFDVKYVVDDLARVHVLWTCACLVPRRRLLSPLSGARRPVQCCERHDDVALISDQQQVRKPFKRWCCSRETTGDPCALLPCVALPDPTQPAPAAHNRWQIIMYYCWVDPCIFVCVHVPVCSWREEEDKGKFLVDQSKKSLIFVLCFLQWGAFFKSSLVRIWKRSAS